ncbi:hypothetical protein D3M70_23450 [Pseudomonas sp. LS-2]|nr:hypothetical protein D3M70_23450 [Pseudomonas sp. LS-2]
MSKPFDMELFLGGVLTGSHATRQRHLRQAKAIQTAIANRWQRDNPWTSRLGNLGSSSNRRRSNRPKLNAQESSQIIASTAVPFIALPYRPALPSDFATHPKHRDRCHGL